MYYIYKHENLINGKVYIGQTSIIPEKRWGYNGSGYKRKTCGGFIWRYKDE